MPCNDRPSLGLDTLIEQLGHKRRPSKKNRPCGLVVAYRRSEQGFNRPQTRPRFRWGKHKYIEINKLYHFIYALAKFTINYIFCFFIRLLESRIKAHI